MHLSHRIIVFTYLYINSTHYLTNHPSHSPEIEMEFTKWPESVTAPVGDKVTFECKVRVPAERLVWRWRHLAEESQWQPVQENYQSNEVSTRLVVEMRRNTKDKYYQVRFGIRPKLFLQWKESCVPAVGT